jgi:hypothetical protein
VCAEIRLESAQAMKGGGKAEPGQLAFQDSAHHQVKRPLSFRDAGALAAGEKLAQCASQQYFVLANYPFGFARTCSKSGPCTTSSRLCVPHTASIEFRRSCGTEQSRIV